MVYSWVGESVFIIEHTNVVDSLRGQGVGNKLLDRAVAMAREKNLKIIPLCPFTNSVFAKDSSIHDVLK
ncbi:N-acetyltransferase [Acinetobacter sp. ANC 4779]|nr:N-acetyltransferase [Acinetobacter sp. ANC 4779]